MSGANINNKQFQQLSDQLHEALWPILLNQPNNPLLFLCSHFRDQAGITCNPVSTAYRTLRLSASDGQHCCTNVMSAFRVLAGADGSVSTDAFLQLLSMLTDGLPNTLATSLMQVFTVVGRLPPSFTVFHDAVKVCMLLEEVVKKPQQGSSSGFMFELPEAKKLLRRLLLQQDWLQSMEPVQQVQRFRAVRLPKPGEGSEVLLDVSLAADVAAQQAEQLVNMAMAAREAG